MKRNRGLLEGAIAILFLVVVALLMPLQAQAEELVSPKTSDTMVAFDLTNHETQEYPIILPDGTEGVVGIEYVAPLPQTRANMQIHLRDGTWKVYWYTGLFNSEYYLDIKNFNIIRAHTASSNGVFLSINDWDLSYGSKWSTYRVDYTIGVTFPVTGTRFLYGNIVGEFLQTDIKGL